MPTESKSHEQCILQLQIVRTTFAFFVLHKGISQPKDLNNDSALWPVPRQIAQLTYAHCSFVLCFTQNYSRETWWHTDDCVDHHVSCGARPAATVITEVILRCHSAELPFVPRKIAVCRGRTNAEEIVFDSWQLKPTACTSLPPNSSC